MKPKTFMVIAGETSGDMLAAELVQALRAELACRPATVTWDYQPLETSLEPRFFGAGGPQMAAAGVDLALDLTAHAVTGFSDVLKNYAKFRRLFKQLHGLALEREPDAIICVDFSGFNRRFAHAIKQYVRSRQDWFHDWNPKIVQYVSPQVWASRESRAYQVAEDFDLLLSIVPFEPEWYAARVPKLRVEFIGHPMVDRYGPPAARAESKSKNDWPQVLLLPASRPGELKRHLPVLLGAVETIRATFPGTRAQMVLPNEDLLQQAKQMGLPQDLRVQVGDMAGALRRADLAIAKTGTITLECAYFGVPTIALYKTSWLTWQIAKRIITVKYGAMPNLRLNREVYPEFIQDAATAENIARTAIELLKDKARREKIQGDLTEVIASLGSGGAAIRAARAILGLVGT
ncbi:MAG TPA: lipid-A-disaccharide synthase [Verrucomicrobiae bacterium]|nr:lipid-A-disaccharide synthase [Verrucomicrobiae bacterium]